MMMECQCHIGYARCREGWPAGPVIFQGGLGSGWQFVVRLLIPLIVTEEPVELNVRPCTNPAQDVQGSSSGL